MEEWKESFREIYKKEPTCADFKLAPAHVRELLEAGKPEKKEETQARKGVKRKNFEMKMMESEQFSPVKKRVNLKKLGTHNDENNVVLRSSPRKKMLPLENSPTKPIELLKTSSPKKKFMSNLDESMFKSPVTSPRKRLAGVGPHFDFEDFSPMKSNSASKSTSKCALTPIKSPTKRPYQRQLFDRDLEMLLMPTPEKCEKGEEEDVEEFDDETNEEVANAKAHKPVVRRLGGPTTKSDQNFQKINLRKKTFQRGKVTAEQKRKLKKKQMFKRKF